MIGGAIGAVIGTGFIMAFVLISKSFIPFELYTREFGIGLGPFIVICFFVGGKFFIKRYSDSD